MVPGAKNRMVVGMSGILGYTEKNSPILGG